MFFQILDEKKGCGTIFFNNALVDIFKPEEMTHTWSYALHLENLPIDYASIWARGATLDHVCPEELKEEWKRTNDRAKSFLLSFEAAKINLTDNCLFDLLPENFLLEN